LAHRRGDGRLGRGAGRRRGLGRGGDLRRRLVVAVAAATLAPAPLLASGAAWRTASVVAIAVSAISAVAPPIRAAGREKEDELARIGASPKPEPLAAVEVVLVLDMVFLRTKS
jgi:hypothetical protein